MEISDNFHMSHLHGHSILFEFANPRDCENRTMTYTHAGGSDQIRYWGRDNNLPQFREDLVAENNIVGAMIGTKREITLGAGIFFYKEHLKEENGKVSIVHEQVLPPKQIQDDLAEIDLDTYLMCSSKNLCFHANTFSEFTRNKGGKINGLFAKQCRHTRAEKQNDSGRILNYYLNGAWGRAKIGKIKSRRAIKVPAYNPSTTQKKFYPSFRR